MWPGGVTPPPNSRCCKQKLKAVFVLPASQGCSAQCGRSLVLCKLSITKQIKSSRFSSFSTFVLLHKMKKDPCQFSSVAQSCPTLCDPMDCRAPGFPVHPQLLELAPTHVHQVGDAIQPSHLLWFPSPPAFSLSQHQGLLQRVTFSHQVAKYWSFSFTSSPSNEYSGLISFRMDWFDFSFIFLVLAHFPTHLFLPTALLVNTFILPILKIRRLSWRSYVTDPR